MGTIVSPFGIRETEVQKGVAQTHIAIKWLDLSDDKAHVHSTETHYSNYYFSMQSSKYLLADPKVEGEQRRVRPCGSGPTGSKRRTGKGSKGIQRPHPFSSPTWTLSLFGLLVTLSI